MLRDRMFSVTTINYPNDEKTKSKRMLHAHQSFRKKIRKKENGNIKGDEIECEMVAFNRMQLKSISKQHRAHPVLEARKLLTYNLITVQGK